MRKLKRILLGLLIVVLLLGGAFAIYVNQGYNASQAAVAAAVSGNGVTVSQGQGGCLVFAPEQAERGLIFYPGGLVEPKAYAPLMQRLAQDGTLCVLLSPPCELAILAVDQADGVQAAFPQIEHWYLGGHSLGGYAAGSYAARHASAYDGLLLLASYVSADLTQSGLCVASVYGTADGVLNRGRYEKSFPLLPADVQETVLEGGCHSFFADYGMQKGDGEPAITREEQIEQTALAFARLVSD